MYIIDNVLIMPLIIGVTFILVGIVMKIIPTKNINFFLGYRTPNSMKSREHWIFAQKYASKKILFCGIFLLSFSLSGIFFHSIRNLNTSTKLIILFMTVLYFFISVEFAIWSKFK